MKNLKTLTKLLKWQKIAETHSIELSKIIDLLRDLEKIDYVYYSLQEFKQNPSPKYEQFLDNIKLIEWAELSLLYHEIQKDIERQQLEVFEKVVFHKKKYKKKFQFSATISNYLIVELLNEMAKRKMFLSKDDALKIIEDESRIGKRSKSEIGKRNVMIITAAEFLSQKGIINNSPIIIDIIEYFMPTSKVSKISINKIVSDYKKKHS